MLKLCNPNRCTYHMQFNCINNKCSHKYSWSVVNCCEREGQTDFRRDVSDSKSLVQGCWTPPADFLSSVFVSLSQRTSPNGAAGDPKLPADGTIISLWGNAPTESLSANIVRLLLNTHSAIKVQQHHGNQSWKTNYWRSVHLNALCCCN